MLMVKLVGWEFFCYEDAHAECAVIILFAGS